MKIIIADDAALLLEGLTGILERQGHAVLARATSADELETAVDDAVAGGNPPDVILTDVRMPPTMTSDGLDAAVRIRSRHPHLGIMLLSQYVAPAYASTLFSNRSRPLAPGAAAGVGVGVGVGGQGYLLKERVARIADFVDALQIVASGGVVIDPEVASQLVADQRSALADLTAREREVLELMARGLSNSQIADHLVLSAGAVAKHVANVFTKLDLHPGEENRRVRAVLTYLTDHGR